MAKKPQPKVETKDPAQIPEVAEYLDELELLEAFQQQHKVVFETYSNLLERVNQKLNDADKAVRGQRVNCGPWTLLRVQRKYDAEQLRTLVGEQTFFDLGGSKKTAITYEIPDERVEAAVARNQITADVLEEIVKETPFYSAPKTVKI